MTQTIITDHILCCEKCGKVLSQDVLNPADPPIYCYYCGISFKTWVREYDTAIEEAMTVE
jgi:hypothetical protein